MKHSMFEGEQCVNFGELHADSLRFQGWWLLLTLAMVGGKLSGCNAFTISHFMQLTRRGKLFSPKGQNYKDAVFKAPR